MYGLQDEFVDQFQEHLEFYYDSPAEVDRDDAALAGSLRPSQDWILSDRDVWYSNPYYDAATYGPRGPHPEDFGRDDEEEAGPVWPVETLTDAQYEDLLEELAEGEEECPF